MFHCAEKSFRESTFVQKFWRQKNVQKNGVVVEIIYIPLGNNKRSLWKILEYFVKKNDKSYLSYNK